MKTPLCETTGCRIRNDVAIVPILRAGIGMLDGILKLVPDATVGFVGLERDHVTAEPKEYYCKLPAAGPDSLAVVVDPMLATGGSLAATVDVLKRNGFSRIVVITILAAPDGAAASGCQGLYRLARRRPQRAQIHPARSRRCRGPHLRYPLTGG